MKDTPSIDAATIGQYTDWASDAPQCSHLRRTLAPLNTRNQATRVAMAARSHLRRTLRLRMSRLLPPGLPPYIQTPPRPAKVFGFGPKGSPQPTGPKHMSCLEHRWSYGSAHRHGKGDEGERTYASTTSTTLHRHPSHKPPHRAPHVLPHLGGRHSSTRETTNDTRPPVRTTP